MGGSEAVCIGGRAGEVGGSQAVCIGGRGGGRERGRVYRREGSRVRGGRFTGGEESRAWGGRFAGGEVDGWFRWAGGESGPEPCSVAAAETASTSAR